MSEETPTANEIRRDKHLQRSADLLARENPPSLVERQAYWRDRLNPPVSEEEENHDGE